LKFANPGTTTSSEQLGLAHIQGLYLPVVKTGGCDDLLTNSGNWLTLHLNHQFCGVNKYHNLLTNTTVGNCLAYYLPIADLSTN
jgi:hypothetical protein